MRRVQPVSYTHLDVYKRQALKGILDNVSADGRVLNVSGGTAVMKDREGYMGVPKAWIQGWGQGLALAFFTAILNDSRKQQ